MRTPMLDKTPNMIVILEESAGMVGTGSGIDVGLEGIGSNRIEPEFDRRRWRKSESNNRRGFAE